MNRVIFFILALVIVSCHPNSSNNENEIITEIKIENEDLSNISFDSSFPELQTLDSNENTIFLSTLESSFNNKTNAIYSATLCMAWKQIQDTIGSSIESCESDDLTLMTNSKSFQNVLKQNEYRTSIQIFKDPITNQREIKAQAYFKKGLPFSYPLNKYEDEVSFFNDNVASFGFDHYGPAQILYYNNDDDFALKLYPDDEEHEIILIKSSFHENIVMHDEINKLTESEKSRKEKYSPNNRWKYRITDEDKVRIPIIKFHLDHHFNNIEGTQFSLENMDTFNIVQFYQKNAFILDENGAIVESFAEEVVAEEAAMEEPEEKPTPKNLVFDKPYIILLKRENSKFPYFAMYVGNSDLMIKSN